MEENLKQKLKKLSNQRLLIPIAWLQANCAIAATKEENLSEEFFNAAMNLDAAESGGLSVEAPVNANAAEQAMAAEQVGEDAMTSGTNVLETIKEFFIKSVDSIQNAGNSIGIKLENFTGSNPFLTKLLVALFFVVISIVIIVVIVLVAKKFILKKQKLGQYEEDDDEFDESKFEDDEIQVDDDEEDDDDFEEITPAQENQMLQEKEQGKEISSYHSGFNHLVTPDNIDSAIKVFLYVTE